MVNWIGQRQNQDLKAITESMLQQWVSYRNQSVVRQLIELVFENYGTVTDSSDVELLSEMLGKTNISIDKKVSDSPKMPTLKTYEKSSLDSTSLSAANLKPPKKIPRWFQQGHRECILPSNLIKLYQNELVVCQPQVEKLDQKSAHTSSLPIIQVFG